MEQAEIKQIISFFNLYKTQSFPAIEAFLKKNAFISGSKSYLLNQFNSQKDGNNIKLEMPKLIITSEHLSSLRNIRPPNSQISSIELSIKFGVRDNRLFSDSTFLIESNDTDTKYCGFHFDTFHPPTGSQQNRFSHPIYHFQFGGENLSNYGFGSNRSYYGRLMFLDTPRISSAPMDLSLALHFIFTNFLPHGTYLLNDSPAFLKLVRDAQKNLWSPFYKSISRHWSHPPSEFAKGYLPQIIA